MKKNSDKKPIWKNAGIRGSTALVLAGIVILPIYFGGIYWAILVSTFSARMMWEWVRMLNPRPQLKEICIPVAGIFLSCFLMAFENYNFVIIMHFMLPFIIYLLS